MAKKPMNIDDSDREQANISDAELDAMLAGSLGGGISGGREADELEAGEEIDGVVIGTDDEDVLIEFGKNTGAIPKSEFHGEPPEPGTRVKASYRRYDPTREVAVLSVSEVLRDLFWNEARVGMRVEGKVIDVNKGGLVLLVRKERAFMPISQIDVDHVEDANVFRDQTLDCEITAIDHDRAELVVSRKRILQAQEDERRLEAIHSFDVGQRVDGTVRRVNAHGAFIDVGGMDGLLHESKIRRGRDVLPNGLDVGDRVRVEINRVDVDQGRISLDLVKDEVVSAPEGQLAETDLVVGEQVSALVSRVRDEGAYLLLDDGFEGFIPIDQLRADPVKAGNVVEATVESIDLASQKVKLKR